MDTPMQTARIEHIVHHVDVCIIGGGIAGICGAISAARHGAKVLIMQDRPMLGGNASSEIRMWISGAHGRNLRETGIIEEMENENQYLNPDKNCSVWDTLVYHMVKREKNIEILLNCSCFECEQTDKRLTSVTGWQTTTQKIHLVYATIFADCSGDSILAPLTGIPFRMGREARAEFDESIAPERADDCTMGMSLSVCAREENRPSTFTPPTWAYHYSREDLIPYRLPSLQNVRDNMWYIELGGKNHAIYDTEMLRDELLKIAYGMWDYLKNAPENKERNQNWRLDWLGMLPGKRESRRYIGEYILTQNDVASGGHFADTVAYGGWTMDDHHPAGFATQERPNIFHPAPSPYGIPYRCLYSRDISNLMFAGRNISATHTALSSTRVLGTCATIGQAMGTAAAIAVRDGLTPAQVGATRMEELQQTLLQDDSYLPQVRKSISDITRRACLTAACKNVENLRNGWDRPIGDADNGCDLPLNQSVTLSFDTPTSLTGIRLVFDSDLDRVTLPESKRNLTKNILHHRPIDWPDTYPAPTLTRQFSVIGIDQGGCEIVLCQEKNCYQRLYMKSVSCTVREVTFIPTATWGAKSCHLFSFEAF